MLFYESVDTYLAELVDAVMNPVDFEATNNYLNYQSLKQFVAKPQEKIVWVEVLEVGLPVLLNSVNVYFVDAVAQKRSKAMSLPSAHGKGLSDQAKEKQ